jgi:hypothetical protein
MNYLITESQVPNLAISYLNSTYGLEKFRSEKHPEIIFFAKDGIVHLEWDIKNSDVYVSNKLKHAMNRSLENIFGFKPFDRLELIDKWIEQYVSLEINHVYYSEALPYPIKELV